MIRMTVNNSSLIEYSRVMNCVEISEETKQRIIRNCARYATSRKIKSRKYKIIAVKKKETTHI